MIALALSRARTRRRRPPSGRRLLYGIYRALSLAWLGRTVVYIATGDLLGLLLAAMWVGFYLFWTKLDRDRRRHESGGVALPPVDRLEWVLVCVNAACFAGAFV